MKEVKEMNKVLYENNEEVVMTKKWVKGQVIMSMPESLKKITNPEKDLRRNEVKFEKNPFIFEDTDKAILTLEIPTNKKKKIVGNSDLGVVNVHTGEVEGGNFLWTNKVVDEEQFAKVYLQQMHHLYGLKKTGLQTLHYLLSKLEPNKDLVYVYFPEMQEFCKWKVRKTCYIGLKELIAEKLIAPSLMAGWWFINPHIIFNGNRLTLVTNYTKKGTNEQTNNLQMLGKSE